MRKQGEIVEPDLSVDRAGLYNAPPEIKREQGQQDRRPSHKSSRLAVATGIFLAIMGALSYASQLPRSTPIHSQNLNLSSGATPMFEPTATLESTPQAFKQEDPVGFVCGTVPDGGNVLATLKDLGVNTLSPETGTVSSHVLILQNDGNGFQNYDFNRVLGMKDIPVWANDVVCKFRPDGESVKGLLSSDIMRPFLKSDKIGDQIRSVLAGYMPTSTPKSK